MAIYNKVSMRLITERKAKKAKKYLADVESRRLKRNEYQRNYYKYVYKEIYFKSKYLLGNWGIK